MQEHPREARSGDPGARAQTRIRLQGELDLFAAERVNDAVSRALAAGAREVILDLAAVSFMDSSGLSALIRAAEYARRRQAVLRCECPRGGEARVVIAIAGLESILGLSPA